MSITNKELISISVKRINKKLAPSTIKVGRVDKSFEVSINGKGLTVQPKAIDVITWLDGFETSLEEVQESYMKASKTSIPANSFEVVEWPEVQNYMEQPGWESNSQLIDSDAMYNLYGDSAYLVNSKWLKEQDSKLGIA